MSFFQKIVEANWTDGEIAKLRHEAAVVEDLDTRIADAKRGYRKAMESTGLRPYNWAEYEELYNEWDDGADYAHDEDG